MTIKSVLESSHKHFLLPLFSSIFLQLLLFTTLHFGNKFKKSRESLSELILVRVNPRQSPIPHTWPCVFSSSQRERPSSETCSGPTVDPSRAGPTVDPSRAGPTVDPSRAGPSTGWKPIIWCRLFLSPQLYSTMSPMVTANWFWVLFWLGIFES